MAKVLRRKVIERHDPEEDFSDVDGDLRTEFDLEQEDPARKAIWVHNDSDTIAEYKGGIGGVKALACRLERATLEEGDVKTKVAGEAKEGDVITRRNHVLMTCDKAKWEKRARFERAEQARLNDHLAGQRQKTTVAGKHRGEWRYVS